MRWFSVSCEDSNSCVTVDRRGGGWVVGVSDPVNSQTVFLTDPEMVDLAVHLTTILAWLPEEQ